MTEVTQPKEVQNKQYGRPDDEKVINFMKIAKPAALISIILTIASIFFICTKGLNLGLDFTGGISAELNYKNEVNPTEVSNALTQAGFKDSVVQTLGTNRDLIVRMPVQEDVKVDDLTNAINKAVQLPDNSAEVHKVDVVGGQVGNELYIRSAGAVALAMLLMLVYVTIRFEFKLAVGAVLSLLHDVIVTIGIFAMMFLGGDGLHWFSVAMFIGVFVGTYSSIYIGTAFALWRGLNRQDFIVQVKPEFDEEEIP